ncbi:MAG: hypothetical protein DRJ29_02850 [Bacteroidetes bacterium]|nr:MAG: hypothetical protein DRI98_02110 [Bacteroidota bacterium]RLD95446.1 MAG: hypothetical protein DRJ29_02850 [Bacteroidota bacterium]
MGRKIIEFILTALGFLLISSNLSGQVIQGKILDSLDERPLAYVNVGVINVTRGTISTEPGEFQLNCNDLPEDAEVRFSMIGYESQTFKIQDLLSSFNTIKLVKKAIELEEVAIKWNGTTRKIGTFKTTKIGGVCGWGGTDFGRGHELGLLLDVGNKTAKIEDLNLSVRKQSFDTIVFRLHIRSLESGLPAEELLTENIYLTVSEKSGWQKIDLANRNIFISGDVVLSLEWIRISNVIEKNRVKMNGAKTATPVVLFSLNRKSGTLFSRRGSEAKWRKEENWSPGFYVSVKE